MRIGQIAPLFERVPPRFYGGTERVVSYLTEELVRQGHDVTLFASGDSKTSAELVRCSDLAIRLNPIIVDPVPHHVMMLEEVRRRAEKFDILHFHIDFLHGPLVRALPPTVTTMHGRLDLPHIAPFYSVFSELPLVAVSADQRKYLPSADWVGTVHHGLPCDLLKPQRKGSGDYLAFLGRISHEKRPDYAIEIAAKTGTPLKIAAKVDRADQAYWDDNIRPLVKAHTNVEFLGEITEHEKESFLGHALALLFPLDWPEPFGLVMIEAMACGTPVIALNRGSVCEVIQDGISGFVVETVDQAIAAVGRVHSIDRAKVRAAFERRFTAERMAREYLDIYQTLAGARARSAQHRKTSYTPDLRSLKRGELSVTTKADGASEIIIDGRPNRHPKKSKRASQKNRVSRLTTVSPKACPRPSKIPSSDEPQGAS